MGTIEYENGPILDAAKKRFLEIIEEKDLLGVEVSVLARPLTPEEAIGTPGRRDFPIIVGRERILEATFLGAKGHAFTDAPGEFIGTLAGVLELGFDSNRNRAVFLATLNAVLRHLGVAAGTVHCKDDDPEKCGAEIARTILDRYGRVTVGMVGLNPAIAEHIVEAFGADRVLLSDLDASNIGTQRFGVEVCNGMDQTDLVRKADVVLMTGTTLQNGTFDTIWNRIREEGKHGILYGVTAAGICALTGIERLCPCGRQD